jgi:hydroxyacylglutathione hydrolase
MIIKKFVVGPLENNCFILADDKSREAFIVDPGDEPERILDFINENKLKVKYIVCTHAHFDHVGAVPETKGETNALVVLHHDDIEIYRNAKYQASFFGFELDSLPEPDILVTDGDQLSIGSLTFMIIHTPGHTPGGICLYGEGILITGDTLFAGSVGRTDLHGGDTRRLRESAKRLMVLDDDVRVLPGHGPESTVGFERKNNFFLQDMK